ncbi:MAG: dimethyl sulfoxide reductase anchor subunit [Candidatus Rokubacteria bacterium]|nr:dimethyl sulfoxide reductase anchor subunit [Candidatus Rokubacteria bacterium]
MTRAASVTDRAAVLLPAVPQRLWGWPAVVNFAAGGLGAGLYLAAAVAGGFAASPAVRLAAWLGPALVLAGFVAVATEAGRPFRGPRVLARAGTSWMSRELWLGGAFVVFAAGEWTPLAGPGLRAAAALAAAALALAQGWILRHARGVVAWDVPLVPAVFLSSAVVSGAGLLMLLEVAGGRAPGDRAFAAVLVLLIVHMLIWQGYLGWSREAAFVQAVRPLREGPVRAFTVVGGYLAPALLIAPALAWPSLAGPAAAAAAVGMIASQVGAKAALILEAGQLRPITLPHLAPSRRSG